MRIRTSVSFPNRVYSVSVLWVLLTFGLCALGCVSAPQLPQEEVDRRHRVIQMAAAKVFGAERVLEIRVERNDVAVRFRASDTFTLNGVKRLLTLESIQLYKAIFGSTETQWIDAVRIEAFYAIGDALGTGDPYLREIGVFEMPGQMGRATRWSSVSSRGFPILIESNGGYWIHPALR